MPQYKLLGDGVTVAVTPDPITPVAENFTIESVQAENTSRQLVIDGFNLDITYAQEQIQIQQGIIDSNNQLINNINANVVFPISNLSIAVDTPLAPGVQTNV